MSEILSSLFNNLILLLAAMYVFSLVSMRIKSTGRSVQVINGFLFGCFGILSMSNPFVILEGVQLDGRGVTVAVSGAQFGWVGAVVSAIVVSAYRIHLGGSGVTIGLCTIWANVIAGSLYHVWLNRQPQRTLLRSVLGSYAALGLISAMISILTAHLLPAPTRDFILSNAMIPMLLLYPATAGALAWALFQQEQNRLTRDNLESERALLRTLIDNVPDYIFAKDKDLRFIATNIAHAEAAHASSTDALIGKTAFDFFAPELAAQYEIDDRAILGGKVVINEERQSVNKDGRPIFVSTTKVPVRDKKGANIGVIGISRDITAQKHREQQERELEISRQHTMLLQTFIQNISHDFRTPLSLISTNAFLAGRKNDEVERTERLKKVADQVNHLTKLLDDIQEIIALDTDQVSIHLMPENIGELVKNAVDSCARLASEHDQVLDVAVESGVLETLVDTHYLQSAIRQLIVNAITFSPHKGVVTIQVYRESPNIVISVKDTGRGIPEQDRPHIFERMYRGDKARSISTGGSGLGLPIVKKVVEAHHGTVTFESVVGQGSTFDIRIPSPSVHQSEGGHRIRVSSEGV